MHRNLKIHGHQLSFILLLCLCENSINTMTVLCSVHVLMGLKETLRESAWNWIVLVWLFVWYQVQLSPVCWVLSLFVIVPP